MFSRLRLGWLQLWGSLANLAGMPGIVRDCDYASQLGVIVRVRRSPFYTVVTVNDVEVYFFRLTGGIDGIGFRPLSDCTGAETVQSVDSDGQLAPSALDAVQRQK
jgi:hypothetical protein